MYLVNFLSLQRAQQLFISVDRYREQQGLVGPQDASNTTFMTPSGEKFMNNLPFFTIAVYYNGLRLSLLSDYFLAESGGFGTGYDTVVLAYAPYSNDLLVADYIIA